MLSRASDAALFSIRCKRGWLRSSFVPLLCLVFMFFSTACSSNNDLIQKTEPRVKDPITFSIEGVGDELYTNVQTSLEALPPISVKRARLFVREIRENTRLALRALGYYNPVIKVELPQEALSHGTASGNKTDTVAANGLKTYEVVVRIDKGKPLFIRAYDVQIIGEGARYKTFRRSIENAGIESYTILNHGEYEDLKEKLRNDAITLGFFDAKIISSRIMVYKDQNVADVELIFDTGARYKFGKIVADEQTKELLKPVETLMILNEGKNFSTRVINEYRSSLSDTNYYKSIDITPDVDNATADRHVPLKINLQRKSKNLMRVGAGFSTDEGARALFEWEKPLLNSKGHQLNMTSKISTVTQDANIFYKIPRRNPNLDYYYINASQTHTDINDTVSDRSHLSFHYVAKQTGVWRRDYALKAEYEDYEQGSELGYGWNLMPSFTLSRRESSGNIDPRRGYFVSFDIEGGSAQISDYTFVRSVLNLKRIYSPTPSTRLILRLQQGVLMGADARTVPPSLRFFAGGDNSIRGYGYLDKAPVNKGGLKGGRYLSTASFEYQFPIGIANSRLAVFTDAGTATDDYSSDDIVVGPGLGYRYISPYGTLRVDVGVGIDNEPKDVRLHFAFGPEF
ncbi:Outer membrane protein/protective antigen OMA87 [Anaerobiospirillum thomasii]|uniref:Translocation and assembly module subunit TamA n=2 Tax=Anaerobiospirillum thomasii TaxID=179995 RepID=A0A2X0V998_9GAMM|nr:Outer membrane protein/protective antigen OMA87 [Anaerobiospirillum thomasii]